MFSVDMVDVSLAYRRQIIFERLNLHLAQGTCTGILGPSGVGKSSLLQLLADLPFTADTTVDKRIVTSDGLPLTGRVALMAQHDNLLPWLSPIDNVLIGYRLRRQLTPERRKQALQLLAQVGFSQADLSKKISELSGGMRQRLALVRTLLEDKALVLMDEPFSALDSITRFHLQGLSAELLRHKTVLLITHDPTEALRLADCIYVLRGQPAQLHVCPVPASPTPRAVDAELWQYQVALWQQLAETPQQERS